MNLNRRDFIRAAAAIGASLAWGGPARASRVAWSERRDVFPEGVASGDPDTSADQTGDLIGRSDETRERHSASRGRQPMSEVHGSCGDPLGRPAGEGSHHDGSDAAPGRC